MQRSRIEFHRSHCMVLEILRLSQSSLCNPSSSLNNLPHLSLPSHLTDLATAIKNRISQQNAEMGLIPNGVSCQAARSIP